MKKTVIISAFLVFTSCLYAGHEPTLKTLSVKEKLQSKLSIPKEFFKEKEQMNALVSLEIDEKGKAKEVIVNAENAELRAFLEAQLKLMVFSEREAKHYMKLKFVRY